MEIRQILKLNKGEWYVSYTTLAPCGCRIIRNTIKIFQKKEPTTKQVENAVNNKNSKK